MTMHLLLWKDSRKSKLEAYTSGELEENWSFLRIRLYWKISLTYVFSEFLCLLSMQILAWSVTKGRTNEIYKECKRNAKGLRKRKCACTRTTYKNYGWSEIMEDMMETKADSFFEKYEKKKQWQEVTNIRCITEKNLSSKL